MKLEEVLQALREGKTIGRHMNTKEGEIKERICGSGGDFIDEHIREWLLSEDWEIMEESQ